MARYCPEKDGLVVYLDCFECNDKISEKNETPYKRKASCAHLKTEDSTLCSTN